MRRTPGSLPSSSRAGWRSSHTRSSRRPISSSAATSIARSPKSCGTRTTSSRASDPGLLPEVPPPVHHLTLHFADSEVGLRHDPCLAAHDILETCWRAPARGSSPGGLGAARAARQGSSRRAHQRRPEIWSRCRRSGRLVLVAHGRRRSVGPRR